MRQAEHLDRERLALLCSKDCGTKQFETNSHFGAVVDIDQARTEGGANTYASPVKGISMPQALQRTTPRCLARVLLSSSFGRFWSEMRLICSDRYAVQFSADRCAGSAREDLACFALGMRCTHKNVSTRAKDSFQRKDSVSRTIRCALSSRFSTGPISRSVSNVGGSRGRIIAGSYHL